MSPPSTPAQPKRRRSVLPKILLGGLLLAGTGTFVLRKKLEPQGGGLKLVAAAASTQSLSAPVVLAPFMQEVVERGEVSSSSNVEIRCMVQGKALTGTTILEIVPEGTYVKEGDFLVRLDDSTIKADLVQQQIAANTSRALEVEALAEFDAAKLALEEYESGTYLQDKGVMENERFVAQENMRRAEEYLRYSLRLAERGYVTSVQLDADRFAVDKARNELENVTTKLRVLERFTKVKTINRLKANVETAEARWRSRQNSHDLDEDRLKSLEDQLTKCVIKAPNAGQVVYANPPAGEPLVAEGKQVRERQIIIRLPDPKRMQVLARINESRIDRVRVGMVSRIRMDAFPNQVLKGMVRSVSEYPLPAASPYNTVKEYGAEITIEEPPSGARSGMTAQVSIEVEKLERALQVPVQSVLERGKRFFCVVQEDDGLAAREVRVGSANEQSVVITGGLSEGEQVILNPQSVESRLELPDVAAKADFKDAAARKTPRLADASR